MVNLPQVAPGRQTGQAARRCQSYNIHPAGRVLNVAAFSTTSCQVVWVPAAGWAAKRVGRLPFSASPRTKPSCGCGPGSVNAASAGGVYSASPEAASAAALWGAEAAGAAGKAPPSAKPGAAPDRLPARGPAGRLPGGGRVLRAESVFACSCSPFSVALGMGSHLYKQGLPAGGRMPRRRPAGGNAARHTRSNHRKVIADSGFLPQDKVKGARRP